MACVHNLNSESYFKSLERVQNYPIVNDSLVLILSYYQWIKSKNSIIDHTLARAEETVKSFKDTTTPIVARKLGFIDNTICNQLERLEKSYPIILESSSTIANIPCRVYNETVHPTLKTVMQPVFKTMDTVSITSSKVKSTMSSFVESSINSTNYYLDKTDELLDKYLPDNGDPVTEQPSHNPDIYQKVKRLSSKTQHRLYRKASKQINILVKSSMEKLEHIQSVIADIQSRRAHLQTTINKEYSKTVALVKDNLPAIPRKYSEFLKETQHHFINLHKLIATSAGSTLGYLLDHALGGLDALNGNLYELQNILTASKPEFISESVINHTNDVINEIRIGLDSFIHNVKDILKKKVNEEEIIEMTEIDPN